MSFLQFVRVLWARRWITLTVTGSCLVAALLAIMLLPERYEAQSRVLMDFLKPDPVSGEVVASKSSKGYIKTQIELIRDYRVTGPVVDALGWTSSPQLLASYNASGRAGEIDFRRWLAQIVAGGTSASPLEGSNILEITYASNNPENARVVADALRTAYIDQSLAFKRESATKSADWFGRQVPLLRNQLIAAEARKTAFERANHIVLQDDQSDTESNRLRALSGQAPAGAAAAVMAGGMSPVAMQLAQLDARIASESQTLGPSHPEIIELKRQRASVAAIGSGAGPRIVGGGGPSLDSQVAAQEAKVIGQRGKVDEARRLQTDVTVLREQYAKTLARTAELRQQAQSDEFGLTPLGNAVTPQSPVFPNIPLIVFGALGVGLGLGVLISLITELLSRRVRGVEDLAGVGVPVIIVMTGWSHSTKPSLLQRLRLARQEAA